MNKHNIAQIKLLLRNRVILISQSLIVITMVLVLLFSYVINITLRQIGYFESNNINRAGTVEMSVAVDYPIDSITETRQSLEASVGIEIQEIGQIAGVTLKDPAERLIEGTLLLADEQRLDVSSLTGRLPENDNEVLLQKSGFTDTMGIDRGGIGAEFTYYNQTKKTTHQLKAVGTITNVSMPSNKSDDNVIIGRNTLFKTLGISESTIAIVFDYKPSNESVASITQTITQTLAPGETDNKHTFYFREEQSKHEYLRQRIQELLPQMLIFIFIIGSILFMLAYWLRYRKLRQTTLMLQINGISKYHLLGLNIFIISSVMLISIIIGYQIFILTYGGISSLVQLQFYEPVHARTEYFFSTHIYRFNVLTTVNRIIPILTGIALTILMGIEVILSITVNPINEYFAKIGEE
ncbi:MAG: hypothetical protein ACRC6X_04915 [Culicoidibacterales bacterium]